MQPGLHNDVPAEVYHRFDAASASRLKLLKRSAAHLRYSLDHPEEPTPALAFGEAAHLACLQPDLLFERYAAAPKCDRRTKEGKAEYGEFQAKLNGRKEIAHNAFIDCLNCSNHIDQHPTASQLLRSAGPVEVSGVWTDVRTGQLCKLRADKLSPEFGTIVDLKTTDDASPDGFERSILKYGYHIQAAMYLRGLAALGQPFDHFVFVCVEKDPPHAVGVYRLDDEAVEAGDAELDELLEQYAECCRSGKWPGYDAAVQTISLPAWHLKQLSYGRIG